MQQLSDYYGITWILCTATQPVLDQEKNSFGQLLLSGLKNVREIISDPQQLSKKLKRVEVNFPESIDYKTSWAELATQLNQSDSVLAIVNTRNHARALYEELIDDGSNFHLSANMCAQHRSDVISEIKQRLKAKKLNQSAQPIRVVSTQLIEAGVDIDFPVVYRAMAGLDSIAQSAGRCNREGKLKDYGQVYVFHPEQASPKGFLKQGEDTTIEMLANDQLNEPLSPDSFRQYFTLMNSKGNRDRHEIQKLLIAKEADGAPVQIQFREAAEKFKLIDNKGVALIVPYVPRGKDESPVEAWLSILEDDPLQKWIYKKLQRYTITVPENQAKKYHNNKCIDIRAGLMVLLESYYDSEKWGADFPERLLSGEESVY